MTIVLIDDHEMFREALADSLLFAGLSVVGVASDARTGVAAVREHRPDVVVMDLVLPGTSGLLAARELLAQDFKTNILMLSGTDQPALVIAALRAGVLGYALKTQTISDLLLALRQTSMGQPYLAPSLIGRVNHASRDASAAADVVTSLLTPRELEVFDLVVAGHTTEETGQLLFISGKTVETHRSRINRKLGVHSTGEMVRLAGRSGRLVF